MPACEQCAADGACKNSREQGSVATRERCEGVRSL